MCDTLKGHLKKKDSDTLKGHLGYSDTLKEGYLNNITTRNECAMNIIGIQPQLFKSSSHI